MTTVADIINDTEVHLSGMGGAEYNRLVTALSDTTSQAITLEFAADGVVVGSVIGIETEDILVLDIAGVTIAKCIRGFRGTTASTHPSGALIQVNPRFTRGRIMRSIEQEIRSWAPRLYAVDQLTITLSTRVQGYGLTGIDPDFLHIINAWAEPVTSGGVVNSNAWMKVPFQLVSGLDTAVTPSGMQVLFSRELYGGSGRRVRLQYAKAFDFTVFVATTNLEVATGVPTSMTDIASIGAAWRLMATREVQRSDFQAQGQSRRAEEVPAGLASQTADGLMRLREKRINEEALGLLHRYGLRGV